jgi:hypothetical protein
MLPMLMEHDVDGTVCACAGNAPRAEKAYRSGCRGRDRKIRMGALNLPVPKLQQEPAFPVSSNRAGHQRSRPWL